MIVSEYTIPGLHVRDHVVTVPLDWNNPQGKSIEFFAREVVDPTRKDEAWRYSDIAALEQITPGQASDSIRGGIKKLRRRFLRQKRNGKL